jgi:ketosteroid isomerase-like protein
MECIEGGRMAATIQEVLDTLIASERANNAHPMADLLTGDFRFIGPAGFVLTGEQFLGRFDDGNLKTPSFELTNVDVREHDGTAVAIGVWTQETTYQGRPNNGNFRFSGVFVKEGDGWKLLNGQLSPMMAPPA